MAAAGPLPFRVRPWVPGRDRAAVVAMNAALQEHERARRPSRRPGAAMAEAHTADTERVLDEAGEAAAALLVAEAPDGRLLGFAVVVEERDGLEAEPREARLRDLYVAPEARRAGVTRALVDAARAFARARSVRRMVVTALLANAEAVAAYRALGFRETFVEFEGEA